MVMFYNTQCVDINIREEIIVFEPIRAASLKEPRQASRWTSQTEDALPTQAKGALGRYNMITPPKNLAWTDIRSLSLTHITSIIFFTSVSFSICANDLLSL